MFCQNWLKLKIVFSMAAILDFIDFSTFFALILLKIAQLLRSWSQNAQKQAYFHAIIFQKS